MTRTRIIAIGGGYSGIMAARRLAYKTQGSPVEITLISAADHFVERVRLHQLAANQSVALRPMGRMLAGTGANFIQGRVTALKPDSQSLTIQTSAGTKTLEFDYLIYALGSFVDTARVPGAAEYALSLSTEDTSRRLKEGLPGIAARGGRLIVCGGGLTGIEAVTELAESYPGLQVSLITRERFGSALSVSGAVHLRHTFDRLGINTVDGTNITRIAPARVEYEGGSAAYDVCLWAGSFALSPLARESGLEVNARGQVIVDDHLRSISNPRIYVVGDSADVSDAIQTPIRMACATALPMGSYAADDLAARLSAKAHRSYEFGYTIRCISLGRRDGLVQFVDADDNPKERVITGWLAAKVKETICRFAVWQITHERLVYYPRHPAQDRRADQSAAPSLPARS